MRLQGALLFSSYPLEILLGVFSELLLRFPGSGAHSTHNAIV